MAAPHPKISLEEYLERERAAEYKSEYYHGEVFAMSGGSFTHSRLATKIASLLDRGLRSTGCAVFNSDLQIHVQATTLTAYPDAGVVCGPPEFLRGRTDLLLNPVLLVEVLSPSSEQKDRGAKFISYRQIPSLREYLLMHQDAPHIELHSKLDGRWTLTEATGLDATLLIPTLGVSLALAELYESITFEAAAGLA